jgi:hypothetical protein
MYKVNRIHLSFTFSGFIMNGETTDITIIGAGVIGINNEGYTLM